MTNKFDKKTILASLFVLTFIFLGILGKALPKEEVVRPDGTNQAQQNSYESNPINETKSFRERPAGTENWVQYWDEQNKIAFLYPSKLQTENREIGDRELQITISDTVPSYNDFLIMSLYLVDGDVDDRVEKVRREISSTDLNFTESKLTNAEQTIFHSYTVQTYDRRALSDFFYRDYYIQRNDKILVISANKLNDKSEMILNTLLLDGSRYVNDKE